MVFYFILFFFTNFDSCLKRCAITYFVCLSPLIKYQMSFTAASRKNKNPNIQLFKLKDKVSFYSLKGSGQDDKKKKNTTVRAVRYDDIYRMTI